LPLPYFIKITMFVRRKMNNAYNISDFSAHLFWDINKEQLDFDLHSAQIIQQVLEYGLMSDWLLLQKIYSPQKIKETVLKLRDLDKVTLNYLAYYYNIEKSAFRCYKQSQLSQNFWNS
jgi:hypothetical protein